MLMKTREVLICVLACPIYSWDNDKYFRLIREELVRESGERSWGYLN